MEGVNSGKLEGTFHERLPDFELKTKRTDDNGNPIMFRKAEFVVEVLRNDYREFIPFEVLEKRMPILNGIEVGDKVSVEFSAGGRRWKPDDSDTYKYFPSLKAWEIKVMSKSSEEKIAEHVGEDALDPNQHPDDLPF